MLQRCASLVHPRPVPNARCLLVHVLSCLHLGLGGAQERLYRTWHEQAGGFEWTWYAFSSALWAAEGDAQLPLRQQRRDGAAPDGGGHGGDDAGGGGASTPSRSASGRRQGRRRALQAGPEAADGGGGVLRGSSSDAAGLKEPPPPPLSGPGLQVELQPGIPGSNLLGACRPAAAAAATAAAEGEALKGGDMGPGQRLQVDGEEDGALILTLPADPHGMGPAVEPRTPPIRNGGGPAALASLGGKPEQGPPMWVASAVAGTAAVAPGTGTLPHAGGPGSVAGPLAAAAPLRPTDACDAAAAAGAVSAARSSSLRSLLHMLSRGSAGGGRSSGSSSRAGSPAGRSVQGLQRPDTEGPGPGSQPPAAGRPLDLSELLAQDGNARPGGVAAVGLPRVAAPAPGVAAAPSASATLPSGHLLRGRSGGKSSQSAIAKAVGYLRYAYLV